MSTDPKNDLNDSLADLFASTPLATVAKQVESAVDAALATALARDPKSTLATGRMVDSIGTSLDATAPAFVEKCPKCRGSGRFVTWSGRDFGACRACKGRGSKTYKTDSATRARNRATVQARKVRTAAESWDSFVASDPTRAAWIEAKRATFGLAESLHKAICDGRDLTPGQLGAIDKCLARDLEYAARKAAQVESAPTVDTASLESAFAKASETSRKPYLLCAGFVITRAPSTGLNAGALYVKANQVYLGKIKAGRFHRSRDCSDAQESAVLAVASDPKAAAIRYGRETGTCACCGRELTNKESIDLGIGPICAEKFGWS